MEKIVFRNEFKRCLSKRLPVSNSYEWSRRIEGALVNSGEVAAFKEIMFLIDSELDYETVKIILEEICQNLRMNSIFRRNKLSIIFWQDKGFEDKFFRSFKYIQNLSLLERLENNEFEFVTTESGDWDSLEELYGKLKSLGQVFFITTEKKIKDLQEAKFHWYKNLMIFYPTQEELQKAYVINNKLCFGLKLTDSVVEK